MKRYVVAVALCVFVLTFASADSFGQTTRKSVSAAEVTGTFTMDFTGKFRGSSDEIKIVSAGKGKLRVAMSLIYPYKMANGEDMANVGEMDELFSIEGDLANYTSEDKQCTMTIRFIRPGTIRVRQDGSDADCGFGHNVVATGTYKKTSSKRPNFDTN